MLKYTKKTFQEKIYNKFKIKVELISEYTGIYDDISYICPKCGNVHTKTASLLMQGRLCVRKSKVVDEEKDSKNSFVVYKHTNLLNGKCYIGITKHKNPNKRWHGGSAYRKNEHFYHAIQKYGWNEGFSHEILYRNLTKEQAENKEIELINMYNSTNKNFGYNHDIGGNHHGSPTTYTRQKISEKLKGKKLSSATKAKMSEARTGSKNVNSVKVACFDVDGTLVKKWDCMQVAANEVGKSNKLIWRYCNNISKDPDGFIWKYM